MPKPSEKLSHDEAVSFAEEYLDSWEGHLLPASYAEQKKMWAWRAAIKCGELRHIWPRIQARKRGEDPSTVWVEPDFSELLSNAKHDHVAFDVAISIAGDLLRNGDALPSPIAQWTADVLQGTIQRPRQHGDKHKFSLMRRNKVIVNLLIELNNLGFSPTTSGKEIASKALGTKGIHLSERGVSTVYENRNSVNL